MPLPVVRHLPSSTVLIHIHRVQCLVETRRVPVFKGLGKQFEVSSPLPSLVSLKLTVLCSLIFDRILEIVDLVATSRPAARHSTAVGEAEARFTAAIAGGIVDVGFAKLPIGSAPRVFAILFGEINVGPLTGGG